MSLFDDKELDEIDLNALQLYKGALGDYVLELEGFEERPMEKSGKGTPLPESTVYEFKVIEAPDPALVGRSARHRSFMYQKMAFKIENISIWSSLRPDFDYVEMSTQFARAGRKFAAEGGGPLKGNKLRVTLAEKVVTNKAGVEKTVVDFAWAACAE